MKFLHAAVLASCLALPLTTMGFKAQAATAHNIQNGTSSTNANNSMMMHSRPMMMKRHHMMRKRHPMMRHKMMRHHMMRPMHKMM